MDGTKRNVCDWKAERAIVVRWYRKIGEHVEDTYLDILAVPIPERHMQLPYRARVEDEDHSIALHLLAKRLWRIVVLIAKSVFAWGRLGSTAVGSSGSEL